MSVNAAASVNREQGLANAEQETAQPNIIATIWPLMLVALIGNLPNPALNIFVGPLSNAYDVAPSTIGSMRGIGGGAALLIGFLAAPLLDRFPRAATVLLGLSFVAIMALLPLTGSFVGLTLAFVALGAALAITQPAVQAACGDFFSGPEAGRAASLVQTSQVTANLVAGPLLAVPAMIIGWQGAYVSIAVAALVTMALVAPRLSWQRPQNVARTGYRQAFALVGRAPGAVLVLLSSTVRGCTISAWLAFLSATLTERFGAGVETVATFWFFGAGAVVVANILTGRLFKSETGERPHWWRQPESVLMVSMVLMIVVSPLIYVAPSLELAFVACIVFCLNVGMGITSLITVLLARYAPLRGAVMGLNATGQNVGIVVGTTIAGIALGLGGYPALAATVSAISALALGIFLAARRSLSATSRTDEDAMPA